MERHAVPQNIMEVEFKLFGALSVKQFAYLASGLIVALIIYFTPFPGALRFVLIIIAVIMGLFLSLVKINGQYSSVWLANFVVAMFTSQERVWKKSGYVPEIFHETVKKTKDETLEKVKKEGRIKASVSPLSKFEVKNEPTQADREEELRLKQIESQMFGIPLDSKVDEQIQTLQAEKPEFVIKGYVVDNKSQPISSALVNINNESGDFIAEAVTDQSGFFKVEEGFESGEYFASITADGHSFDYYKVSVNPGEDITYKFSAK